MKNLFKATKICFAVLCIALITAISAFAAAVPGDVNGSGAPDAADARLVLRYAVGLNDNLTAAQIALANVDGDNAVTAADARIVLRASVGLEIIQPAGHTHSFGAWTAERNSAKVVTGRHYRVCSCGEKEYANCSYGSKVVISSVLEEGYCTKTESYKQTCSVCAGVKASSVEGQEHLRKITSTTLATCSTAGSRTVLCTRCNRVTTEVLPKLRHKPDIPEATETQDMKCTKCGIVLQYHGPKTSEYEMLKKDSFFFTGYTVSGGVKSPISIAMTPNSTYMYANMDSMKIGIYIYNGNIYMVDDVNSTYIELTDAMFKMLNINKNDIIDMTSSLSYKDLPDLSSAKETKNNVTFNGATGCTAYIFELSDGSKYTVYCRGNELMGFGTDKEMTYVDSVSEYIPAEYKSAPSVYFTKANMIDFFTGLGMV